MWSQTTLAITIRGVLRSSPQTPHNQPKNNREINKTAAFMRAKWLCSQVIKTKPIAPATSIEVPATTTALKRDPNCIKAAMKLANAINTGPR